jgi:hypothetical protein
VLPDSADNIQLRPAQQTPLTKNTSYSVLALPQRQDELQLVLSRVRELEEKLQAAEEENEVRIGLVST